MKTKVVIFFFLLFSFLSFFSLAQDKYYEFAGSFYPKDPQILSLQIDDFLKRAKTFRIRGEILGIVSPHAGYIFSGSIAAFGYKAIEGSNVDTVIILGPSHRYYFKGIAIWRKGSFFTPLGKLEIDDEIAKSIGELSFVKKEERYFFGEHSLEVQLPFILKTLGRVKIVPLVFGDNTFDDLERLSDKLVELSEKKKILIVVSTDLSHYLSYEQAVKFDNETIERIVKKDIDFLWISHKLGEKRLCGIYPLVCFLLYVKKKEGKIEVLKYANSGDTYGDKKSVVGYLSAIAYKKLRKEDVMDYDLTKEEKKFLLDIARRTLESYLKEGKIPKFEIPYSNLFEKRGVFVTLKKKGQLRGCIGRIVADMPLWEAVSVMSIESATRDPRFPPVDYQELKDIEIEISVLSPFEKVNDLEEIRVGRDGLMIQKGFYSGLLLPQVPVEYGWDRTTFLEHLCLKAGLPPSSYKDKDATIYKFTAIVFSEKEF